MEKNGFIKYHQIIITLSSIFCAIANNSSAVFISCEVASQILFMIELAIFISFECMSMCSIPSKLAESKKENFSYEQLQLMFQLLTDTKNKAKSQQQIEGKFSLLLIENVFS